LPDNLNKQRILDYLKACYAGDIERASSYYDDEIDFIAYAPIQIFPTLGQKRGKVEMTASLQGLNSQYGPIEYDVTSIVAEDDRVAVMLDLRLSARGSGRVISLQIANFYTLRGGRIRTYRQFLDSFDVVQQKLRRDLVDALKQPQEHAGSSR
jgi:ketosteroid isomerase-like protein